MKKIVVAMMSMAFLLRALPVFSAEDADKAQWYPFVLSEKLDPSSPANVGKLVLDPPAGKHGFVKVKGNRFVFEDGTPARFWGTNLCFSACFPSKEQAVMMADRLAFFGFNAVRLHHMDFFFEPNGIFEDVRPATDNPQLKKTGVLSPRQLDKLDYLIYLLKERGIYVDINLLVARHFTISDGVRDADMLGMAAKPVSIFDPKLIDLQKQYAKDMLTHYNPYTKLRYCDDPAIALVEITNENSLFDYWKWGKLDGSNRGSVPSYYIKQLDNKWGDWLKIRYGATGKADVRRPTYRQNTASPEQIKDIEDFYTEVEKGYFDDMLSFLKNEIGLKIPITGMGGITDSHDISAQINCDFIDKHTYWDHPTFPGSQWNLNEFRIHNKSALKDKELGIVSIFKKYTLPNKPYTSTEWNHCYPNQYSYETPALFAYEARKSGWDAVFQFAFAGVPIETDKITNYFDIISNPQQLLLCSVGSLIYNKSVLSDLQIIDGAVIIDHKLLKGAIGSIKDRSYDFYPLKITSHEDGAVIIFSPDLSTLDKNRNICLIKSGPIKNSGGGFFTGNTFVWGAAPTLLRKMSLDISADDNRGLQTFILDRNGTPSASNDNASPWMLAVLE